jgi:hypothetical protein
MKTKTFSKKLELNKKTISNLDNNEMDAVHGGTGETFAGFTCNLTNCASVCPTCIPTIMTCPPLC